MLKDMKSQTEEEEDRVPGKVDSVLIQTRSGFENELIRIVEPSNGEVDFKMFRIQNLHNDLKKTTERV